MLYPIRDLNTRDVTKNSCDIVAFKSNRYETSYAFIRMKSFAFFLCKCCVTNIFLKKGSGGTAWIVLPPYSSTVVLLLDGPFSSISCTLQHASTRVVATSCMYYATKRTLQKSKKQDSHMPEQSYVTPQPRRTTNAIDCRLGSTPSAFYAFIEER